MRVTVISICQRLWLGGLQRLLIAVIAVVSMVGMAAMTGCGGGDPEPAPDRAAAAVPATPSAPAGTRLSLSPAMLSQVGLTAFDAQAAVDADVTTRGWHTDLSPVGALPTNAPPGARLQIDLGRRRALVELGIYAAYAAPATYYVVHYSDDLVHWNLAIHVSLSAAGWNYTSGGPGLSVGAHRYWRIVLQESDGPGPWLTELALWGDGHDYSAEPLNAGMLSQHGLTGYIPAGIVDGDVTSHGWHTDSAEAGARLSVDLGTPRNVAQINVHELDDEPPFNRAQYIVQWSDDNSNWQWAGMIVMNENRGWRSAAWVAFAPHRYWRLVLTSTAGVGPWLSELEFLVLDRPRQAVALEAPLLDQSGLSGYVAAHIADAHPDTLGWHTDAAAAGAWLQTDLGRARSIVRLSVYRVDDTTGHFWARYQPQWSDDAQQWRDIGIALWPLAVGWNAVDLPDAGPHRYWRLRLLNTPGPAAWISELALEGVD